MLSFLLLLRSCLSSWVAVLRRRLFLGVRSWCRRLRSLRLSRIFCVFFHWSLAVLFVWALCFSLSIGLCH
jgi:hypothetical protein